jgi:hypothetical protein
MDLRVTLQADDGALISMKSFGLRHGPPEVIPAIGRGESVDPATYVQFVKNAALLGAALMSASLGSGRLSLTR